MNTTQVEETLQHIWPEVIGVVITKKDGKINLSPVNYQAVPTRHELPYSLCIGMSNQSKMLEDTLTTGKFVYAYPSVSQIEDILYCGTVSGRVVDKLAATDLRFTTSKSEEVPLLENAVINYRCHVATSFNSGYFTIVIGYVDDIIPGDIDPSEKIYAFGDSQYGRISGNVILQVGRLGKKFLDTPH